jgi:hypothetical protein
MEEGATFTEWAFTFLLHVLAWFSLVVGVDSTKSSFTKVLWKWVISLSEFVTTMSKLTELLERAILIFNVMLA